MQAETLAWVPFPIHHQGVADWGLGVAEQEREASLCTHVSESGSTNGSTATPAEPTPLPPLIPVLGV